MSVSPAEAPSPQVPEPYYDDEIDLRQYLDVLIAWWREILLIAVLMAALAALAVILSERLSAPAYSASADVVIARVASDVTLDERVQTLVEDLGGDSNVNARRAALVELVKSGPIAASVIGELGDVFSEEQRVPSVARGMIDVSVPTGQDGRTLSDLIRITATADSPEKAAQIASSWAKHYVETVNALYGEVPADVIASLQSELTDADAAYQSAQREFEAYVSGSRVDALQNRISEQVALRDAIQAGRTQALTTLAEEDRKARREILLALTTAQLDSILQVFSGQAQARAEELERLYLEQAAARQQLDQARNLRAQVEAGGEAAARTNSIALQLLKAKVFSGDQTPIVSAEGEKVASRLRVPADLVVNADSEELISAEDQQQDIDALVTVLEDHLEDLDRQIQQASEALVSGDDYDLLEALDVQSLGIVGSPHEAQIDSNTEDGSLDINAAILQNYEDLFDVGVLVELSQSNVLLAEDAPQGTLLSGIDQTIQTLRADLAAEQAQEQYLRQKRDLAWNTYDALSNRAAELYMELSSANSQVRVGALAVPPSKPIEGPSLVMITGLAFAFGLLLGVFIAFLSNYLGHEPFLRRSARPA